MAMRHVHSRDTRKKLAQDFLRAIAGLPAGTGRVTIMKYDATDGYLSGRVARPLSAEERRSKALDLGAPRLPRSWVPLGEFHGFYTLMVGTQGEPAWRPRADGQGVFLDLNGRCDETCKARDEQGYCYLHGPLVPA